MKHPEPDSSVDLRGLPRRLRRHRRIFEQAARETMRLRGVRSYAVSITFVDDREISRINKRTLQRPGATDVIAFDLSEKGLPFETVGDVYVSTETALDSCARYGVDLREEIARLIVHGLLHVIGHTDDRPAARRKMLTRQERIVKRLLGSGAPPCRLRGTR